MTMTIRPITTSISAVDDDLGLKNTKDDDSDDL